LPNILQVLRITASSSDPRPVTHSWQRRKLRGGMCVENVECSGTGELSRKYSGIPRYDAGLQVSTSSSHNTWHTS